MTLSHAKALLGEFQRHAQLYSAFSISLGLLFGAMDGPQQPLEVKVEKVSMEDWRKSIPAAPRELGFWRQFILTTPGVALALRLGLKGQELKASPGAILLTMMPTLWGPLLLYLFVGYPLGTKLHRISADG
eukprot:s482_g9.t1